MEQNRHKRLYNLHSWTGLTLGLLIFIVSFTGCIALFDMEIRSWEDPAQRIALTENQLEITPLFDEFVGEALETGRVTDISLRYPQKHEPYFSAFARIDIAAKDGEKRSRKNIKRRWHPVTGAVLAERGNGLSHWLLDIHRRFMLPTNIGRSLVGIIGLALMLSILTGVVIHSKLLREMFTMRLTRSVRLKWQDMHKVLGLWGLPFFSMIAFTGAFLGIITLLGPIVALIAFKGDQEALIDAVIGVPPEAHDVQAQMLSADELRQIRHPSSGKTPALISMANYGDTAAQFTLYYTAAHELSRFDLAKVNGATGAILPLDMQTRRTAATRISNALTPLHYGTYGGFPLKVLYFVLGLALCLITALGLMLWAERRMNGGEGKRSPRFYERLNRFNTGTMLGLVVASTSVFHLDKLYTGAEAARLFWTGSCYFEVWFIAIAYACFRSNQYQVTRALLAVTGLGLLLLPITNGMVTGDWLLASAKGSLPNATAVDWSFLTLALITLIIAFRLPRRRD